VESQQEEEQHMYSNLCLVKYKLLIMIDYYDENGVLDNVKVVNAVKEIDDKLKTETDKNKRTQLMFEQMLRGLYLTQVQGYL
jgi:hypothetical protein